MYVRRRTERVECGGENGPCVHPGDVFSRGRKGASTAVRARSLTVKSETNRERTTDMLYTIAVILIILWLLGLVTSTTMGGFIHVLLVIAVVVVLLRVINGRSPI